MKPIEPHQLRTIFAIGRSLGMDNDDLHALVEGQTGHCSIKQMSSQEAYDVIGDLKARQKSAGIVPPPSKRKSSPAKPGGVTKEQQGKMWALIGELEKLDTTPGATNHRQRLCGVIKKELNIDAAPSNPFSWLTMEQGKQVIDALNRYVKSAYKTAARKGGVGCG
jgi:hypothetical protein